MHEQDLDILFQAARHDRPIPSGDLIARVVADAEAESLRRLPTKAPAKPDRRPRLGWLSLFGSGGAVAGLLSATLVGIWVGFSQPVTVSTITQSLEDAIGLVGENDPVELIPSFDPFSLEG